jgi:hypothetical protein
MASEENGDVPEVPKDAPPKDRDRDRDKDKDKDKDLSETLRARLEQLVPDLVRRTFTAGLGAVFSTEEGIRKITKELQLPSMAGNVAGYIADTADNTKDKVLEVVAREVRDFLSHVNLTDEITRLLTTLSFEIKTEIRFIPNSERYTGVDPDVKAQVRLKRTDKGDEVERDATRDSTRDGGPRDATRDEHGRLRRLWRRATGNGTSGPAPVDDDDVPDENE